MITDRPDHTESSQTVPAGMFQIEAGYTFIKINDDNNHSLGELLVRVGMLRHTELRVSFNSYTIENTDNDRFTGRKDFQLGFKYTLNDISTSSPWIPQTAVIAATTLPTGSESFRSDKIQPEVILALSWEISERAALGSNIRFAYLNEDNGQFAQLGQSISLGYGLTDNLGCYLEYFGMIPGEKKGANHNYMNGGITFLIGENFQLDTRGGVGMNGMDRDYFSGTGISLRF